MALVTLLKPQILRRILSERFCLFAVVLPSFLHVRVLSTRPHQDHRRYPLHPNRAFWLILCQTPMSMLPFAVSTGIF